MQHGPIDVSFNGEIGDIPIIMPLYFGRMENAHAHGLYSVEHQSVPTKYRAIEGHGD
jgi:hypothetical protein